jgi:uncharacterized protein YceK
MTTILLVILCLAIIAGIISLCTSDEPSMDKKVQEAVGNAAGTGLAAGGCVIYLIITALPFVLGLLLLRLIFG